MHDPKSLKNLFDAARTEKLRGVNTEMQPEEVVSMIERRGDGAHTQSASHNPLKQLFSKITPMKAYSILAVAGLSVGSWYYMAHHAQNTGMNVVENITPPPAAQANGNVPSIADIDTTAKTYTVPNTNGTDTSKAFAISNDSSKVNSTILGNGGNNLLYSNDNATMKISLNSTSNQSEGDSTKLKAGAIATSLDSMKTLLIQKLQSGDTGNTFMDSIYKTALKAMNNIVIDTSNPGNPTIEINEKNLHDFSVENNGQKSVVRITQTAPLDSSHPDSTNAHAILLQIHTGKGEDEDPLRKIAAQLFHIADTLTIRINLHTGSMAINSLPIDSAKGINDKLFKEFYLQKEHLNAITMDTGLVLQRFLQRQQSGVR